MPTLTPISQLIPTSSEDQTPSIPLSNGMLAYFRARLSNRIHEIVLTEFVARESEGCISRAELARRIRRKPEQITRWLGSPGNWTLDTVSDLLLGMGLEPALSVQNVTGTQAPVVMSWSPSTVVFPIGPALDLQTPEEVVKDVIEGNYKSLYFSLKEEPLWGTLITTGTNLPMITSPQTSYICGTQDFDKEEKSYGN